MAKTNKRQVFIDPPVWKDWIFDDCPICGNHAQVLSEHPHPERVYDSEAVRCVDDDCGNTGQISFDEEDYAYVIWR